MKRTARRHQQAIVLGGAGAMLVVLTVVPLLAVLLGARPPWSAAVPHPDLQALGWMDDVAGLLATSSAIAAAVSLCSVAIGVPLGLYLARFDVPGRWVLLAAHAAPIFLPPFLPALGWYYAVGRSGMLESATAVRLLFGPAGVVATLVLSLSPVVTLLVVFALGRLDGRLQDTARVVAPPHRVAWWIVAPLVRPAAALGALLVFVLAFSELAVPMFLRVRTYPAAVFARLGGIDFAPAEAATLCAPLAVFALGLLAVERSVSRRWAVAPAAAHEAPSPLPLGRWRWPVAGAALALGIVAVAPLAALTMRSGWRGFAAAGTWLGGSLWTSLVTGASAASIVVLLALVLGHAAARRVRGAGILDAVAMSGFVAPAALIGVGVAVCWNRPSTRAVYASVAVIVLAYSARYAALGVRLVAGALGSGSEREEEAAASVGAGYVRRLVAIVVPRHAAALAGVWLLVFVFCLRDLDAGIVVHPPGGETLLVRIFTLEANGPEHVVAALAMVQVAVTWALVSVAGWLTLRRTSR